MTTESRPSPEVRLAQAFEVFDVSPIKWGSSSMVVSVRVDGRAHYALPLVGKPQALRGVPAVVAFDSPKERRVLGWCLPTTGEVQIVQGWNPWLGLVPAGLVTACSIFLATRIMPSWAAVMIGLTMLRLSVWRIQDVVRKRQGLKDALAHLAAANAVPPPDGAQGSGMNERFSATLKPLLKHWGRQSTMRLAPGLSDAEITDFERRHAIRLPEDFAAYLRLANGFKAEGTWDDCDDQTFEFFPLREEYLVQPGYLKFCEWVVGMNDYGICVDPDGPLGTVVALYGEGRVRVIAPSFSAFATLYIADDSALYGGAS